MQYILRDEDEIFLYTSDESLACAYFELYMALDCSVELFVISDED